jgi:murein DD-endopeptidase MepM/ murein hydrolase activator NlpD
MPKEEKKKTNWRDKYRFSVINDHTLEEVWRIILTRYNAFLLITFLLVFIVWGTSTLISFTNLREFIPGYPDVKMRRNILMSAIRLDSIDRELKLRDKYFENLNTIISGGQPIGISSIPDTTKSYKALNLTPSSNDSALRAHVEKEDRYNLTPGGTSEAVSAIPNLHFYIPVKGIVSGKFDPKTKHFGTDIVAKPKAIVSAALDGTIIFTGWTTETGFVIAIQHPNNLVTIYKHNSGLMKEAGDLVSAGDAISVVGDSGERYTSGPHLHFEIWYKGSPLDPEKHISF